MLCYNYCLSSAYGLRLNARLPLESEPLLDLGKDFSDGTRLIQLIVTLIPSPAPPIPYSSRSALRD